MTESAPVVALSGGVGGTKLVLGLTRVVDPAAVTVIANTGDDFDHFGLRVCPDIDTLVYTLAGLSNPETGWGRAEETGVFMSAMEDLGEESWFFLGDKDIAMHVARTRRLGARESLSAVTGDICRRLGVESRILPMSDDPVPTLVETDEGVLAFQHYFVRERCAPRVRGFRFDGAGEARPNPEILDALGRKDLRAVVVAPSNPFISIDPILAVPEIRATLCACDAPAVAVSPVVHGDSIKGPTAKMMRELDIEISPVSVAERYADFIDGIVIDTADAAVAAKIEGLGLAVHVTNTMMDSLDDRIMLARDVLEFCDEISRRDGDDRVSA